MKKRSIILPIFMVLFLVLSSIPIMSGCGKEGGKLKTIRLNEVAHSIFYAPMYVAIENGYFEEEGLKIDLQTGFGAV